MDYGASHHITYDMHNLSIHFEYNGKDNILVGNGNGNNIFVMVNTPHKSFALNNVLCASHIIRNLLSISQFCKTNSTSIEFFPSYFAVKDLSMGAILICG